MYRIQRKKKHESKKNSWEVEIGIPLGGGGYNFLRYKHPQNVVLRAEKKNYEGSFGENNRFFQPFLRFQPATLIPEI